MNKRIHLPRSFFSTGLFLYLIPAVFLLERYRDTIDTVSLGTIAYCQLLYCAAGFLFAVGFWRIFKDDLKAHLMTAYIILVNCYFGPFHFFLVQLTSNGYFSRFRFLLPFVFGTILLLFYLLYKGKKIRPVIGKGLSLILVTLVALKCFQLIRTIQNPEITESRNLVFTKNTAAKKPDIYLLVTDGYAGYKELNDLFKFKNDSFYRSLRHRGFWVADSSQSNYSLTPLSMSSAFSMNYRILTNFYSQDLINARRDILHNPLWNFFKELGYSFKNYSIFQPENNKDENLVDAFPSNNLSLINGGTLIHQLSYMLDATMNDEKDFFHIDEQTEGKIRKSNTYSIESLKKESTSSDNNSPKIIYSHIIAPHFPYLFDSLQNYYSPEQIKAGTRFSKKDYLSYMKGWNHIFLRTIDSIKTNTNGKAVIILMSDHGFRQFKDPEYARYYFKNLLSIYTPEGKYDKFYEGISNVNFFRAFLNQEFQQELPMLKDSMIIYYVKGLKFKSEN